MACFLNCGESRSKFIDRSIGQDHDIRMHSLKIMKKYYQK